MPLYGLFYSVAEVRSHIAVRHNYLRNQNSAGNSRVGYLTLSGHFPNINVKLILELCLDVVLMQDGDSRVDFENLLTGCFCHERHLKYKQSK